MKTTTIMPGRGHVVERGCLLPGVWLATASHAAEAALETLELPGGFCIEVFATGVGVFA